VEVESVFNNIASDMMFDGTRIKIDRIAFDKEGFINSDSDCLIVHGEGGSGKSGMIKDCFQCETSFPVFIFRATDFESASLPEFSRKFGNYTFEEFLNVFQGAPRKLCIIDSAEKFFTMAHQETMLSAINLLIRHGWKIIITTRTSYKDNLINSVLRSINIIECQIEYLKVDELAKLGAEYSFALPSDSRLCNFICNLFYLNLYLSIVKDSEQDTTSTFRQRIWDEIICNGVHRKERLHVRRGSAICHIVMSNINTGIYYYVHQPSDDSQAMDALLTSGIIAEDKVMNGYYLTHDVYEEIVLKYIIQIEYNRNSSPEIFFCAIGNSLVMRKAFRSWLHDPFESVRDKELPNFIAKALQSGSVEPIWKDDILISVLNEPAQHYWQVLEELFIQDDYDPLFRATSLLDTACKVVDRDFLQHLLLTPEEIESHNIYRFTKPSGAGWDHLIKFICEQKNDISWKPISIMLVIKTLKSWVRVNPEGVTTQAAGRIALYLYHLINVNSNMQYRLGSEREKSVISVVLQSAQEIFPELTAIFEDVLASDGVDHRETYYDICVHLLSEITDSRPMCGSAPSLVIALANCFWLDSAREQNDWYNSPDIERDFGVSRACRISYYPASALQTPIFVLLQTSPIEALDFIVDLLNQTTEKYRESRLNKEYNECSTIQVRFSSGKIFPQTVSSRLWELYRGASTAPSLLESALMALERWLYLEIPQMPQDIVVNICKRLLCRSSSAAITAVVVSMATAFQTSYSRSRASCYTPKRYFTLICNDL